MAPERSVRLHADLTQVSVAVELTDVELCHEWRRSFLAAKSTQSHVELCHEWRRSFLAAKSTQSHVEFMPIVALRQLYLDEVGRRSPPAQRLAQLGRPGSQQTMATSGC